MTTNTPIKSIIEAALMAAGEPLNIERMLSLFPETERPNKSDILVGLEELKQDYQERAIDVVEIASGYCIRVRQDYSAWISRLWEERPARYSRAFLETLALIAYKQPVTRAEIEKVRGVAVSSNIIKTLLDRNWIKIIGHRDIPGKPSLYATTKEFLDYFSLKSLEELPTMESIQDLEQIGQQLEIELQLAVSPPVLSEEEMEGHGLEADMQNEIQSEEEQQEEQEEEHPEVVAELETESEEVMYHSGEGRDP